MTYRVLDLFSCVGGHALGLSMVGPFETTVFVEYDAFRRGILQARFPDVPQHDDVRTYHAAKGEADVVIGGPPCQRTSVASAIQGYRTGDSLWSDMSRIVDEAQPEWVVVEQPAGNAAWETQVAADLARTGYYTSRIDLSAADFGGPHIRRRVFLLANRDVSRLQVAREARSSAIASLTRGAFDGNPWSAPIPRGVRVADGLPSRVDRRARITAVGDSNPPIMMAAIGTILQAADGCYV